MRYSVLWNRIVLFFSYYFPSYAGELHPRLLEGRCCERSPCSECCAKAIRDLQIDTLAVPEVLKQMAEFAFDGLVHAVAPDHDSGFDLDRGLMPQPRRNMGEIFTVNAIRPAKFAAVWADTARASCVFDSRKSASYIPTSVLFGRGFVA